MPKSHDLPGRDAGLTAAAKRGSRAAPAQPSEPQRRQRPPAEPADTPVRAQSVAAQLAVEVERLERELAAARAEMATLAARAEIDPLTDVLNRRGFERELKRSLAYVKRYGTSAALVYLDLDGFKAINDGYGHAAGDTILKAVAMLLTRHVRASDLVARIGGDEFCVLLWNLAEADAAGKALSLEDAIARTTATHGGNPLTVGASVGVVMMLPLDTPAGVLDRADRAMYARKIVRRGLSAAP